MKEIKLKRQVYATKTGVVTVHVAEYGGEKCYAVVHNRSGFISVFDYDKRVWESMKRFMRDKGYSIYLGKSETGVPKFNFGKVGAESGRLDLRQFLYARYNKRFLSSMNGIVLLRQDDRADNFCDLRRHNLYMPSEGIADRDSVSLQVVSNPKNENEQAIEITFRKNTEPFIEHVQYTPELFEMLNNPRYVRLETISQDRGAVEVDGYDVHCLLGKFVCIYKKYFPLYQGKRNAVQKFIHEYKNLSELEEGNDAAHINAYYHEHMFDNLMFMKRNTNHAMSDYIKWLADGYEAYTAVNDRDEILLEFITPLRESPYYYKFETPEDYADFQRVYIFGKKFSKKMQRVIYPTPEGLAYQLTPAGMRAAGIVSKDTVKAKELDFWTDREHKDKLLSLPDDAFTVYHKETLEKMRTVSVNLPEEMKKGDIVFFPHGSDLLRAEIVSVDLIKAGRKKVAAESGTPVEGAG